MLNVISCSLASDISICVTGIRLCIPLTALPNTGRYPERKKKNKK